MFTDEQVVIKERSIACIKQNQGSVALVAISVHQVCRAVRCLVI